MLAYSPPVAIGAAIRSPLDIVPPEGFERGHLDRDMYPINQLYSELLGEEYTPVNRAIEVAQHTGNVALLDVGCGTGYTLYTWRKYVRILGKVSGECIGATGISRYNYSGESESDAVAKACAGGYMRYVTGDAAHMDVLPDGSQDVVHAFNSMMHAKYPYTWLHEMLRVAAPDGAVFFNLPEPMSKEGLPLDRVVAACERAGMDVQMDYYTIPDGPNGEVDTFFCIMKNGKPLSTSF